MSTTPTASPADLIIRENVRRSARLTPSFISSIRSRGVLVPVVVVSTDAGLEVVDGQRRTLAALEAGLTSIPIHEVERSAAESWTIETQLVTNEHRDPLTAAEEARAYRDLTLFGLAAGTIAKKLHLTKSRVERGLAVAGADDALATVDSLPVSLEQAAVFAEFSGESEVLADLTTAVAEGRFDHVAERARFARREREVVEAAAAPYRALGVTVLTARPSYRDAALGLIGQYGGDAWVDAAGDSLGGYGADLEADAARLPAEHHAVYVRANGSSLDALTARVSHYIVDPAANGYSHPSSSPARPPLTEDEREERRANREAKKAWGPASSVREKFLQQLLQRKSLPATALEVLALALTDNPLAGDTRALTSRDTLNLAALLLSVEIPEDSDSYWSPASGLLKPHAETRPLHTALAIVLALAERSARDLKVGKPWRSPDVGRYLATLAAWGYELSEVEQGAVALAEADDAAK